MKASEQAVEEQLQAHTEAEAETFAADVVEVTNRLLKLSGALKWKSLQNREPVVE
ncbi:hypothetical protein ACNKHX_21185 [Shigella flexneri]